MYRNLPSIIVTTALFLVLLPGLSVGADYTSMSTEDLSALRGTMFNASQEDRDAFREEWTKRINQMTPEQKQQYLGSGGGRGQGNRGSGGLGDGQGRGRGGGSAGTNQNGVGQGNGQGNGQGSAQGNGQGGARK